MLDEQLAKKFIDKIASYTSHNVNIINARGVIVAASKDLPRIGSFHQVAYQMMEQDTPISSLTQADAYLGVQPGVNMVLTCKGKKMGVVGVTGNPDEVYDIALIIRMSLETMIEYESQYELLQERKNTKLHFINTLLYTDSEEILRELPAQAQALSYDIRRLRLPLLIDCPRDDHREALMEILKHSPEHCAQDIMALTRNGQIILFKSFSLREDELFQGYRGMLEEYLAPLLSYTEEKELGCHVFAGSFQQELQNYHDSFRHCTWLRNHLRKSPPAVAFFYDYVNEYMDSQIPFLELHKVYGVIDNLMPEDFSKNLTETVTALERTNYNLNAGSRELFIHKNTLVFRFNKIKSFFAVNPLQESGHRSFLYYLNYYLKNRKK